MGNKDWNDEGPGGRRWILDTGCSMLVVGIVNFKSDLVIHAYFNPITIYFYPIFL